MLQRFFSSSRGEPEGEEQRDYREGWHLPTVETELNGDSKKTNERYPFLAGRWASRVGTRDFYSAVAALVGLVQNIFFLTENRKPIAQQAGQGQPCWIACLLVCVSGEELAPLLLPLYTQVIYSKNT